MPVGCTPTRRRSSGRSSSNTRGDVKLAVTWLVATLIGCSAPVAPRKLPPLAAPAAIEKPLAVAALPAAPDRLPHTFEPTSYAVQLALDPDKPDFVGTVKITGQLAEPSALIWVNAENLRIVRASAARDGAGVRLAATSLPHGMLALQSDQPLTAGAWTITIEYVGTWNTELAVGGFRQTYEASGTCTRTSNRTTRAACSRASTSRTARCRGSSRSTFRPSSSRRATRRSRATCGHGTKTVQFARTPAAAELPDRSRRRPVRDRRRRDVQERHPDSRPRAAGRSEPRACPCGRIDAEATRSSSRRGSASPFPYPKLDLVIVPSTVEWWGAMENAGLITFAETYLDRDAAPKHRATGDPRTRSRTSGSAIS